MVKQMFKKNAIYRLTQLILRFDTFVQKIQHKNSLLCTCDRCNKV